MQTLYVPVTLAQKILNRKKNLNGKPMQKTNRGRGKPVQNSETGGKFHKSDASPLKDSKIFEIILFWKFSQ